MNAVTLPRLMTEAEVAEYLGVSKVTVARARRDGKLNYLRVGGLVRFTPDHVASFVSGEPAATTPIEWPEIRILPPAELLALRDPLTDTDADRHGVYFLWLAGRLVYVGQSGHVGDRVWQHQLNRENSKDCTTSKVWGRAMEFDCQRWLPVPWPYHLAVEAAYIARYQPQENRRR